MTPPRVQPSRAKARDDWTVTPTQAILGRRIGFRHHWSHWASGLTFMFGIGIIQGIKIGRHPRRRAR
jgi:hypothetical protein